MTLEEMRKRVLALQAEMRGLTDKQTKFEADAADDKIAADKKAPALTEDEEKRFKEVLAEADTALPELRQLEERAQKVAALQGAATGRTDGFSAPAQHNSRNPFEIDLRDARPEARSERRDAALKIVEESEKRYRFSSRQMDEFDRLLRAGKSANLDSDYIAQRAIITESDAYHRAFMKGLGGDTVFEPDEARAISAYRELERRAASEGTMSAGGYGVPVLIDPTIVLTSGALDAPIMAISKVVTITTDQWKGVTSTGLTFEITQEASVVADKTPTLAQPTIPVYRADGFIPYSFEIGEDYPGFAEEMAGLLEQGYINLLAQSTMTGSGSSYPTGIFTALKASGGNCANGTSGKEVTLTTLGTLGAIDIRDCWSSLGELFRQRSSWVMNVTTESVIRAFGNNLALSDFTQDLTAQGVDKLVSRPVVLSDYAPTYSTATTTVTQYCVLGDFSKFLIVQRAGMVVEQVQHLFDPTTGRPTGQRAWLAWSRYGHNALDSNPFRVLSNGG
jgi:HK97 family phage major capsid protein